MKQQIIQYKSMFERTRLFAIMKQHPRRTELAIVGLFFGLLAALFMGPILFHFGSAVHGFWGDGTGGLIWLIDLNLPPFGGPTDAVIYPYGDNLFRPDFITASLFMLPFWLIAKLIGGIATWNLIVMLSFWLSGVSMYYFVKKCTNSPMAALWAGVAFAYMPMHQYKAFGHIAYLLVFIFVFVLWQILNFLKMPTKKNAVLLGLITAATFYVDGYFVLFTLVLVGVPLALTLLQALWRLNRKTVEDFKALLISLVCFAGTCIVVLLPIIACKILYGAQISAGLALARGDFMSNVAVYTARWYDFVIPIETHPVFGSWATAFRTSHNHGSNTSEHTLYLGLVLLTLVAWTLYFFWKNRKTKKIKELQGTPINKQTIVVLCAIALVALLIALQSVISVFGLKLPMPSRILSEFVQYWRVYARLILIIQLIFVVIGSIGLAILLRRVKSQAAAWLIVGILIVITFFEYLSFNPFRRQDIWYYGKLSSSNQWLKEQKDIKVIAVYPLVDQPNGLASLYTTEQTVNGKKMINSGTISTKQARLRAAIGGLNDPQTLPVLKALGVQAIMTHEMPTDKTVEGLVLAYGANEAPAGYAADVDVFRIKDSIGKANYALVPEAGVKDAVDVNLQTRHFVNDAGLVTLRAQAMPGVATKKNETRTIRFAMNTTGNYAGNTVIVTQGKSVIDTIRPGANETLLLEYTIDVTESLTITVVGPLQHDSLFLSNLRVAD